MGSDRWGIRTLAAQLISSRRQHIRQLNSSHLVGNQRDSSTHLGQSNIPQPAQINHISASGHYRGLIHSHSLKDSHVIEFTIRGSVTSHEYVICDVMIAHSQTPIQRTQFPFPILYSYPASLSDPLSPSIQKPKTENRKSHFE